MEACGKPHKKKVVIHTVKKFYRPPLTSTYKETELLEELNNGMEWVLRDYGRSIKQEKGPLPPRDDVVEFDVWNNAKELDNNMKLQVCPNEF